MWHWNSLWAPSPGDPKAVDDPSLYRMPWTPEQAFVMQARMWDTAVSASRAWWTFWLASCTLPGPLQDTGAPAADADAAPDTTPSADGAEPTAPGAARPAARRR